MPFLFALLFVVIIGYFNFLEYGAYGYTQFDLGVGYRTLYNFHVSYHLYNWPFPPIETPQTFSKLIYVPLSFTLYVYNSPLTLLFDQIILISLGGIALFYTTKLITDDYKLSIAIEIVYFLYPATYGFMTQGGNLMVFFEPLLLMGYFFYLRGNKLMTGILFILASITNAFAPLILMVLLALPYLSGFFYFLKTEFMSRFTLKISVNRSRIKNEMWKIIVFIFPLTIFIMSLALYGVSTLVGAARLVTASTAGSSASTSFLGGIFENFSVKLNFFNEVFQPLLYLPLLTLYSFPVLIYLLIAWYSNKITYYDVLPRQYSFLFTGILFISLVYSIKRITPNRKIKDVIGVLIIITTIVSFALYSPFSVGNFQSGSLANDSTITPLEKNLTESLGLIPLNSSVLTQNDIVQVMNRQEVYFPGYYSGQAVDYAIFAPPGQYGIENPFSGFYENLANKFANNSAYGLYVKLENVEIYKYSYTGTPVRFSSEILSGTLSNIIRSELGLGGTTFSISGIFLSPGYYNLSLNGYFVSNGSQLNTTYSSNFTLNGTNGISDQITAHFNGTTANNNLETLWSSIHINDFATYSIYLNFPKLKQPISQSQEFSYSVISLPT